MVEIIQENRKPTFLDRLGVGLNQAAQSLPDILERIQKNREEAELGKQIKEKYGIDLPRGGQVEFAKAFGKAAGEQPFKEALDMKKAQQVAMEREEENKGITDTLDWIDKNAKYSGKFGVPPKWGGIEAQGEKGGLGLINPDTKKPMTDLEIKAKREEIDQAGLWLADRVYTHYNKGVLNQVKWEDVKERFSMRSDLPATINRARAAAIKRIIGLDSNISPSGLKNIIDKEIKALDKIEKGKTGFGDSPQEEEKQMKSSRPSLSSFKR